MLGIIPREYGVPLKAAAAVGVAIVCAAPVRVLSAVLQLVWTCLGIAVGVGLGLGFAMHVYEQLQGWQKAHELQKNSRITALRSRSRSDSSAIRLLKGGLSRTQSSLLEDASSYLSLMALAGYVVDDKVLRAQVLKGDAAFWDVKYRFTDVKVEHQRGPKLLKEDWPGLPEPVTKELGRFVEHVMRDYISGWYSRLDGGCVFMDEKEKRALGIPRDGQERGEDPGVDSSADDTQEATQDTSTATTKHPGHHGSGRRMVFSTLTHRTIPMLDQTYRLLSFAFGSLATRAEHLNLFSLALLKWTQVLAHTFKQYRHLRKVAEEKNQTNQPTEMQIIREFLLAGKLHKAVTFGLDVPSLLFADAQGTDCGSGEDHRSTSSSDSPKDATQVLEDRLFGTPMLKECELDYNRVVAFRLVRALLPRNDSSSNVLVALVTEIMGACVLQPLMNLWTPPFLNELIINSMNVKPDEDVPNGAGASDEITDEGGVTGVSDTGKEQTSRASFDSGEVSRLVLDTTDPTALDHKVLEAASSNAPGIRSRTSSTNSKGDLAEEEIIDLKNAEAVGDLLLKLSSIAVTQLKRHVNLEECRVARLNDRENNVDYDDPSCQEAVLRLVMVVEAALLHGRCAYRQQSTNDAIGKSGGERFEVDESLSQLLMEMTSDMNAFEKRIDKEKTSSLRLLEANSDMDFEPEQNEVSTVRTLISTWMHTGQLSRAIALVIKGMGSIFLPYYSDDAFLATKSTADAFRKQMDAFDKVDIMVETMAVLASPRLDIEAEAVLIRLTDLGAAGALGGEKNRKDALPARGSNEEFYTPSANDLMTHNFGNTSTPRFLDFHRNAAFASSLRSERERRLRSWESQKGDDSLHSVHRPGASQSEVELHNELHNLARTFYNGTNVITIRDAAKKNDSGDDAETNKLSPATPETGKVSLVTVETVSNRRRIEVPDDDSSFLLRAQPRPLNPVSVHRDDRNHDLSYKCFLATYEEPATANVANRNLAGRYIRRCFLQYYPIDRTATIMLHNDARKLDRRKGKSLVQDQLNQQEQPPPYLSGAFLRERHLCQKWTHRGTTAQSFLSSSVMEATDFNATPRNGRALDFVYKLSLFERPTIDLAGKRFTVHDSTARGHHRADASSLEVSDASLSALLFGLGRDIGRDEGPDNSEYRHRVEMGPDGYPMLFMKFSRKSSDDVGTEIKPYRMSFVRAALMVTSARQEAQLQCLMDCVKAGSAKSATKARTDAQLKPTMKILSFANDRSSDRMRASTLLRDLKLGIYHIDREQLRRNGLLNPRFPTSIRELSANVEVAVQARDVVEICGGNKVAPASTLYKIRCVALVDLIALDDESPELEPYISEGGAVATEYREEWVVYRSMKDFQALHKQLKSEVANAESSASAGSRLVGAAAAAFSAASQGRRNKKALIPSLAQASKTGAIAVTQKAIIKRGELLKEYLEYLLSPGHIINRCMELLLFLGASFPFPSEIQVTKNPVRLIDPLGRTSFTRQVVSTDSRTSKARWSTNMDGNSLISPSLPKSLDESQQYYHSEGEAASAERIEDSDLIEAVLNKVDQVPLADVRNRLVELVKYQFGFENASFFRSRLLSALETASFVAMTKGSEFRKLLYNVHLRQLNPEAISKLIEKVLDILWPDGCWLVPRPILTKEEEDILKEDSQQKLHDFFPEQIRAILGRELTRDGLDMVHEMLQNRLVVKSLFYMLFDLLWIEVFPELRDALPCASALDID